jgi:predicted ATPase/DNA-binding SARP family transcriptional activator
MAAYFWRVELLGGLRVQGAERMMDRFYTHRAGALLAYLAYFRERRHPREALAEMLWPDAEQEAARLSLRVTLSSLRRQLEPPGVPAGSVLIADRFSIGCNPEAVTTDVAEFEGALASTHKSAPERLVEELTRAVALYRGDLLTGYDELWILPERERLAEAYRGALERLSDSLENTGDYAQAIDIAQRGTAWDPFWEEMHLRLMRLYEATDRPGEALRQYAALERHLRQEIGAVPSPAARALAERLRQAGAAAQPERSARINSNAPDDQPARSSPILHRRGEPPLPFTRLFGREEEIERLCALLLPSLSCAPAQAGAAGHDRLITLLGPGGCGKTRLSLETARRLSESFPEVVYFVPLAGHSDRARIADAVADALRLERDPAVAAFEQVAQFLAEGRRLLVVDNLEHLLPEAGDVIQALLERAPGLTCLATSRQQLGIGGEQVFPVPPLQVPSAPEGPNGLMEYAGVRLFVDRAQHVRPDFQVTAHNAADVAALCCRLEGMPLALELTAAWAQMLTPAQMVERLCDAATAAVLLVNRDRNASPRHRSLHAAIAWSYDLLSPELRRFFTHLSVFRGGFTLEMVESVCLEIGEAEPAQSLAFLVQLTERSLILADETDESAGPAQMRYGMLESLREFAGARLEEGGEADVLRRRYCEAFLRLAETTEPYLLGPERRPWLARLEKEQDNLRAALSYAAEECDSASLLIRLCASLWRFWQLTGRLSEGRQWLERALTQNLEAPGPLRAKALFGSGALAYYQGEYREARLRCEESEREYRALGDPWSASDVLSFVCQTCDISGGDAEESAARTRIEECLSLSRSVGNRRALAGALCACAQREQYRGHHAVARELLSESLHLYQELGDSQGSSHALWCRGDIALYCGDYGAARADWEAALTGFRDSGDRVNLCHSLESLAYLATRQADYPRAEAACQEALEQFRGLGSRSGVAGILWKRGDLALVRGDYAQAKALHEEALTIRRAIGQRWGIADSLCSLGLRALYEGDLATARTYMEQSLSMRREAEDKLDVALALANLGEVAWYEGKTDEAESLYEESLQLCREMDSKFGRAISLMGLGRLGCSNQGDAASPAMGELRLKESLRLFWEMGDRRRSAEVLEWLATTLSIRGEPTQAARLWAASATAREAIGAPLPPVASREQKRAVLAARRSLGVPAFDAAWTEGAMMGLEGVIVESLQVGAEGGTGSLGGG